MSDPTRPNLGKAGALAEERARSARLPGELYGRVVEKLETRAERRSRRSLALALSVCTAVVLVVGLWWGTFDRTIDGFEVRTSSADFRQEHDGASGLRVVQGAATFFVRELACEIGVVEGAHLRRDDSAVRVLAGSVTFGVQPRHLTPLRVLVSDGAIEVVGTRFTVTQRGDGGTVSVETGVVRFVDRDGKATLVRAGERLTWPFVAKTSPSPPVQPAPTAPTAPVEPERSIAPPTSVRSATRRTKSSPRIDRLLKQAPARQRQLLEEIEGLMIRHADAQLVATLEQALGTDLGEPLREQLSFELCDALARKGSDTGRACAHLNQHLARYPHGEFTAELERTRALLGCGAPQ
jgi:transmembrane sensor